jgi:predicted dehydrogenase|tara:strand:- start:2 stop:961 length:960 start_codon:yes stop_codon:yes gene_type:complete
MRKIVLVGSGDIGSRHLQALCKSTEETAIEIIEQNEKAINRTKSRLDEVKFSKDKIKFKWKKTIQDCSNESDLVIVATLAEGRAKIIKELLEKNHTRFIIEKMVCQSQSEYDMILENMNKYNARGWVNTRYRYFDFYKKIKSRLKLAPIHISVTSSFAGLSTGTIHYMDLFNWLTETDDIKLNGDMILPKILSSKRSEKLVEFSGLINGKSEYGSISITYLPEDKIPHVVSIEGQEGYVIIDEISNKILNASENFAHMQYQPDYISNITTKIVKDILNNNNCELPTIQDLYNSHMGLFQIFNNHLEKSGNEKRALCPIT